MSKRNIRRAVVPAHDELEGVESIRFEHGAIHVAIQPMIDNGDGTFSFDYTKMTQNETITGNALIELMSANPTWAPGKPQDKFQVDDLWHIIDEIKAGKL